MFTNPTDDEVEAARLALLSLQSRFEQVTAKIESINDRLLAAPDLPPDQVGPIVADLRMVNAGMAAIAAGQTALAAKLDLTMEFPHGEAEQRHSERIDAELAAIAMSLKAQSPDPQP